ncbi:PilN domain-containing protein [Clostridium formicaceticum]|uniref:Fimbrial assembly protein (PilN) n=1 Tax=Clostridium formicaceticum TaxID=1497 RepID=A0AAC9RK66_9CLOT|nr:PilN domain-containing protein [Clostridium formicaceticum]AOY77050.1 hypothetical protein BJL90_15040 [Clostridium formicaceticum]ARE87551.1 Fimbrial assembly protein (PilN) [Clostridium formicaceticum]
MRDFNFFEPYIKEPEKTNSKRLVTLSVLTIVGFMMIFYPVKNFYEVKTLQKEIAALNEVLEAPENIHKLQHIEVLGIELAELKEKQQLFNDLQTSMEEQEIISDLLIQWILQEIPHDIYFDSINVTEDEIQIQSKAPHKFVIAQMEHNLRHSIHFDEVFIPSITENNGYYSFSITFKAKDVTADGVE